MNPEKRLNEVAGQIKAIAEKSTGKVRVVRQGLNIVVVDSATRTVPSLPIASFDADKAKQGLTASEWANLSRRLEKAAKEIAKCREQSKP